MKRTSFRCSQTPRLTKLALGLAAFLVPALAMADGAPISLPAMVRSGKDLVQKPVVLDDLTSNNSFQGKYFTVVDGETDVPVSFLATERTRLQAATVYVAFSQSRAYFIDALKGILPTLDPAQRAFLDQPMVIRLNLTHLYSSTLHFDHSHEIANGAVTVPASGILRDDSVPAWGAETWFFIGRNERVANPASPIAMVLNNSAYKLSIFEALATEDAVLAIADVESNLFSATVLAENLGVSLGLSYVLPWLASLAIHAVPAHVYLDAAMIPEIAANEYAHYALSPWLGLERRFHVGEGYAHFFAAKITHLVRLQDNGGAYSSGYAAIRGDSSAMYTYANEVGALAAMSSFTFSVLMDLEKQLGADGLPVIIQALAEGLSPTSNLKSDFTSAILAASSEVPHAPGRSTMLDELQSHLVFSNRGF